METEDDAWMELEVTEDNTGAVVVSASTATEAAL